MKILCFGDSNTYGYDPRSYFGSRYPAECRWVDILADRLGCMAVNAGENGREIPSRETELTSFDRLLTSHQPVDRLVIMLGSNDLLQNNTVEAVVQRMERFLRHIEMQRSRILLVGPPPMQLGEWVPDQSLIDASVRLNQEYKVLSARLGVRFWDSGAGRNLPLSFDGVHFTEEAHRIFAEGLISLLNEGD